MIIVLSLLVFIVQKYSTSFSDIKENLLIQIEDELSRLPSMKVNDQDNTDLKRHLNKDFLTHDRNQAPQVLFLSASYKTVSEREILLNVETESIVQLLTTETLLFRSQRFFFKLSMSISTQPTIPTDLYNYGFEQDWIWLEPKYKLNATLIEKRMLFKVANLNVDKNAPPFVMVSYISIRNDSFQSKRQRRNVEQNHILNRIACQENCCLYSTRITFDELKLLLDRDGIELISIDGGAPSFEYRFCSGDCGVLAISQRTANSYNNMLQSTGRKYHIRGCCYPRRLTEVRIAVLEKNCLKEASVSVNADNCICGYTPLSANVS